VDDSALLQEYAESRSADAFSELFRRYAGLVYGVCLRVTRNPHDAEDVAQECFLELARNTSTIRTSLPRWPQATATNHSLNALRSGLRRQSHESQAMPGEGHRLERPPRSRH